MFDAVCMYVCLTSCLVVGIGAVVLLPLICQVDMVQLAFGDDVVGLRLCVDAVAGHKGCERLGRVSCGPTQPPAKHLRRAKTNERWVVVVPSTVIVLSPCLQSTWKGKTALAEHRKIVREVNKKVDMWKLEYNIGGCGLVFLVSTKLSQFVCLFERMWWKEGGVSCARESVSVSVSVRKDVVGRRRCFLCPRICLSFCVCSKGCGGKKVVFLVPSNLSQSLCLFERMWSCLGFAVEWHTSSVHSHALSLELMVGACL